MEVCRLFLALKCACAKKKWFGKGKIMEKVQVPGSHSNCNLWKVLCGLMLFYPFSKQRF